MEKCHDHQCSSSSTPSVHQTLNEMEFERGIWQAALDGDDTKINKLLDKGVDVNIRDEYGYTALHYAARQGCFETVRLLLSRGADINAATRAGRSTALHRAAHQGDTRIAKILLDSGASAEFRDVDGKTALHKAAEMKHLGVYSLLVTHCPALRIIEDNNENKPLALIDETKQ